MYQQRKYFGMTASQVGILAGLAVLVCCLFGIMGYLVLGDRLGFSRSAQLPPTPIPTSTLIVIPTITQTPPPTSIPYEQLIPNGWVQYRTGMIEIWFPPQYRVAKSQSSEGATTFANTALIVSRSSSLYNMWGAVAYEPLTTDSLDTFLDTKIQSFPVELRVVEKRATMLNSIPAERILIEGRVDNIDINELAYVVQDGGTIWYVLYVAQINDFYDNLENFEASARTFRLVR